MSHQKYFISPNNDDNDESNLKKNRVLTRFFWQHNVFLMSFYSHSYSSLLWRLMIKVQEKCNFSSSSFHINIHSFVLQVEKNSHNFFTLYKCNENCWTSWGERWQDMVSKCKNNLPPTKNHHIRQKKKLKKIMKKFLK